MDYVKVERDETVARVFLSRGKVNALNSEVVAELRGTFESLKQDDAVRGVILTSTGPFFSFGFDVPELLGYSRDQFTQYLHDFTALYTELFLFPKPLIAALNGHTVAGGCMLATTCDYRIMATGKGRMGLNEVTFGASVFAGSVEMVRHLAGHRNAERILLTGELYSAEAALQLGLVERVCASEELAATASEVAAELTAGDSVAYAGIKGLLRGPIAEQMRAAEAESIREFVEIWYSESTQRQLQQITIRS